MSKFILNLYLSQQIPLLCGTIQPLFIIYGRVVGGGGNWGGPSLLGKSQQVPMSSVGFTKESPENLFNHASYRLICVYIFFNQSCVLNMKWQVLILYHINSYTHDSTRSVSLLQARREEGFLVLLPSKYRIHYIHKHVFANAMSNDQNMFVFISPQKFR